MDVQRVLRPHDNPPTPNIDMTPITRRNFIKGTALVAGAFAIHRLHGVDSNSEVRVAIVGLHGRGGQLIEDVLRTPGARLVALCDVDTAVLAEEARKLETTHNVKVDQVTDFRKLIERSDIDAVAISTPNHWHALQTIWACQAGKDVYVEKPVCHTVWEGQRMMEAARQYNRIVQAGFQNRSDVGLQEAFAWIKEGNLGKITQVRGLCYKNRSSIGKRETPLSPPPSVDYNLWLGPAANEPIYRNRLHYDWHWLWNTGNGDIGNQGPHEMDLIRWALGEPDHPQEIFSMGGRFAWEDAGETPNTQLAAIDWGADLPKAIFEVRNLWVDPATDASPHYKGIRVGVIVTCEGGEFRGGRGGGIVYDENNQKQQRFTGDGGFDHFPSFIRAVNSRKQADLACPLETGYKSTVMSHLTNISYRLGKEAAEKRATKAASKNESLQEAYQRFDEQLHSWNVDLGRDPWSVGPTLRFDPDAERFIGGQRHQRANTLLRREYRKGFEVPENV